MCTHQLSATGSITAPAVCSDIEMGWRRAPARTAPSLGLLHPVGDCITNISGHFYYHRYCIPTFLYHPDLLQRINHSLNRCKLFRPTLSQARNQLRHRYKISTSKFHLSLWHLIRLPNVLYSLFEYFLVPCCFSAI